MADGLVAVQEKDNETETLDPTGADAGQYRSDLHRYLMRRLGSSEDARDLAQEAYLRYLQLPDAGVLRKPSGYLFRIAVNLIYEWRLRRDRSMVTFNSDLAERRSDAWTDGGPDLCDRLSTQEYLQEILERIPLVYRRVLIMNKVDGMDYRDIARQLELTPDTVLKYLARATAHARRAQSDEPARKETK